MDPCGEELNSPIQNWTSLVKHCIVQWAHIGSYECTWSSCECIFGLHSDHMVPYQHIFDPQRPIWIHIKAVLGPYGFLSGAFLDRMYPYAIIWSHIGVLWIHVGYLLGPYGSTAPHWIHRNPCLTDVVSIWISCWIQFCLYAQVLGTCQQHMEPHWAHI